MAKPQKRSRRRARPSLLVVLLILLIGLIGWIFGLRLGDFLGGGTKTNDDQKPAEMLGSSHRKGLLGSRGEDQDVGDGSPFSLTSWRQAAIEKSAAGEPSPLAEGGLFSGPAWLRLRAPRGVALEDVRVRVEAVHGAMPGLRGRRWLLAEHRVEPSLILLQVDTAPGGLWIEIGIDDVYFPHFLSGPHEVAPWSIVDLGRIPGFEEMPEVLVPEIEDIVIRPRLIAPPGRERPLASSYPHAVAPSPVHGITRRATEQGWVPRLFGPYEFELHGGEARGRNERELKAAVEAGERAWNEAYSRDIQTSSGVGVTISGQDQHEAPAHTLAIRPAVEGHDEIILGNQFQPLVRDFDILFSGGMRAPWEWGGSDFSVNMGTHYSVQEGVHLRMPTEVARRVRALHASLCEDREKIADRLALETLLFRPEPPVDRDPATANMLEYALLPGRYHLFDLELRDEDGVPKSLGEIEGSEHGEVIAWSPRQELPTRLVAARVIDAETGDPIAGAEIVIGQDLDSWALQARLPSKLVTDAKGRFVARGLPEGELGLLVQASGYEPRRAQGTVGLDETEMVTIALERAPGLVVLIRDREGAPIVLDGVLAIGREGHRAQVALDTEGRAHFPGLSSDRYVLLPLIGTTDASFDDWDWLERESGAIVIDHPREEQSPITFLLPRPVPVVLDIETTGPAPERFILHIQHGEKPPAPGLWPRLRFENVSAGRLAVDSLPPGRYLVVAEIDGGGAVAEIVVPDREGAVLPVQLDFD